MGGRLFGLLMGLAAFTAAGCGAAHEDPPSPACTASPARIMHDLRRAPAPVRLSDGSRLSGCVAAASGDADLQNLGAVLTQVSDALASRLPRHPAAAVRLGYLVGAVRKGSRHTSGLAAELERRIGQSAIPADMTAAERSSYARALRAGARTG